MKLTKLTTKKDLFKYLIKNKKNRKTFDPWIDDQSNGFDILETCDSIETFKGYTFLISGTSGGGCGMGEYPPTNTILILHKF